MNKKYIPILKYLSKANPGERKNIISNASPKMINTLCECCLNILRGNVPLTPTQKKKLCKHKKTIRRLANEKMSLKNRKRVLQRGGFLPLLLAPLLAKIGIAAASGIAGGLAGAAAKKIF